MGVGNRLVERNRGAEEGVDDVGVVVQLLVHHEGEDAHLSSTAVVQLDGQLLVDGLLVPARCFQLSSLDIILAGSVAELDQADEGHDLGNASGGDGVKGSKAVLHGGEGNAVSDLSWEADASGGHQVAEDGQLGDAAVLGLNGAQALEAGLVRVLQKAQRIPEAYQQLHVHGKLHSLD